MSPMEGAIAGLLVGMARKSGFLDKLPTIPMLGRMGSLALAAHFYSKHGGGPWAKKVALASAILAGEEMGREGKIAGEDISGLDGDDE